MRTVSAEAKSEVQEESAKWFKGLLEIVDFEMMVEQGWYAFGWLEGENSRLWELQC